MSIMVLVLVLESSGKAEAQRRSILRIKPSYTGKVYLCPSCHRWHVGRRQ
mgnify:CR=1 FL=1